MAALLNEDADAICARYVGQGFAGFKADLIEIAVQKLSPMTEEMNRLMDDPAQIDAVLRDGAERARALSEPIINEIHDIVGFLRP
jgi:tryptophanyl-tRNA synthetase